MGDRRSALAPQPALHDAATAAWFAAIPCAALAALLVLVGAEPLGRLVAPPLSHASVFPWERGYALPEPREEGGYALALLLPFLLALATVQLTRSRLRPPRNVVRGVVSATRAGVLLLVAACLVAQPSLRYGTHFGGGVPFGDRFFTPVTLVVGVLLGLALATVLRVGAIRRRVAGALRDTPARRVGAVALAVMATVLWLLHAVNTDDSVAWSYFSVWYNLPFTADDTFAVLNGLTPFVDHAPLYASLWPFVAAIPLAVFGKTLLAFTITMCALSAVALLAVLDLLRRAAGSVTAGLALYVPFLATSLFIGYGTQVHGYSMATYFGIFPLRYAGPLLLAAFTARRLDGHDGRSAWPLFTAAGLVVLNNANFGVPALIATFVALAAQATDVRALLRLVRDALLGALLALAALSCLTLLRAGALPDFGQASLYTRYFAGGYASMPLRGLLGLHLIVFMTYVAAIGVAVVRVQRRMFGVLTGMLAWSGVFGLGALSYFIAESGPHWLKANFSAWGLAMCMLAIVVVRRLAAAERWPSPPELAVLFGIGVMACSVAQLSAPWTQLDRLTAHHRGTPPAGVAADLYVPDPTTRTFVASLPEGDAFYLKRGAPVALLLYEGHRIADAYGIVNVSPYANIMTVLGPRFVRVVVAALRRAGGNTVVMPSADLPSLDVYRAFAALGFGVVTRDGIVPIETPGAQPLRMRMRGEAIVKLVDLRVPRPAALQGGGRTLVARMRHPPSW